jgi:prolipoprotein diacylglyceryltransferase
MFPILQIGPLAVQTPGLLVLISIWLGLSLAGKHARDYSLPSETLNNLVLTMLVAFLLGGRASYVVANLSAFLTSPLDMLSLNISLFDPAGGAMIGLLAGLVAGRRQHLPFWRTLDALTPFLAVLMAGIGTAHLASGAGFGAPTSLPWGVELFGAKRHPSQVYEIAAAVFILSAIGMHKPFELAGKQFLLFTAASAAASLFLQAFRGDGTLTTSGLRLGQIAAWIVLAAALFILDRIQTGNRNIFPTEQHG